MNLEFTQSFDRQFKGLNTELQEKSRQTIDQFIGCYAAKQFPKGLRVHKCGPFVSLSVSMNHRIFVLPIPNGIKFVFVGDHKAADRYLKMS